MSPAAPMDDGISAILPDGSLGKFATPQPTTAAASAATAGDVDALKALPAEALGQRDDAANTPLIWACHAGQTDAVQFLIGAGVDVNVKGFLGNTALSRAARHGHVEIVKALLGSPSMTTVNALNDKKQTPLHFAAFRVHPEVVAVMLESGLCDTAIRDRKGRTPAEDTSDAAIREMILAARA
mmetsp:Transcript_12106/g.27695  ORF Transcript_12106/g.27695 Transcript_12106/m.27695 type:complete len:183 (-) Transcript_12106:240-788(-)